MMLATDTCHYKPSGAYESLDNVGYREVALVLRWSFQKVSICGARHLRRRALFSSRRHCAAFINA